MLDLKIKNLTEKYNSFENGLNQLIGQRTTLLSQIDAAIIEKEKLESTQKIDEKSIEVLNLVQKSTREKITQAFEQMVTYALQSIYQDKYEFKLEFNQRGNIGELNFKLKDPKSTEFRDLTECVAGGSLDIISLALRFVLIQVMRPKVEGFICIDEGTKMISSNYRQNEHNFYNHISKSLGRQLILITHSKELIELAENKILIGK